MPKRVFACLCTVAALAACGPPPERYIAPSPVAAAQQRVPYGAIALREVSLPAYAASEEIALADQEGRLQSASGSLWADDPMRAVTLDLVRALSGITGARVASEPWPFASSPDAAVDVRFEEFLASGTGVFTARGMYFVAPDTPGRPERARSFEIAQPFDPDAGYPAIAAARTAVLSTLAAEIARRGLN